jgi:hypothetical protein
MPSGDPIEALGLRPETLSLLRVTTLAELQQRVSHPARLPSSLPDGQRQILAQVERDFARLDAEAVVDGASVRLTLRYEKPLPFGKYSDRSSRRFAA